MTANTPLPPINRGLSLVSLALVLAIVLLAAPIGMQKYADYTDQRAWNMTAEHHTTVSQGARRYIKDNYISLLNKVKDGKPHSISVQELRGKNYLPPGFALTNNNNQTYLLSVARNPDKKDSMVAFILTTGGSEIPFKGLRFISTGITGLGGYIYPDNIANGAGGGWQVDLKKFGLSGKSGHIVSYLSSEVLGTDAEEGDRLYRIAVPGSPHLNQMKTSIDLNENDINNGRNINAKNGNFSDSMTATNNITSNNGWIVTQGDNGWKNTTHNGGFYMSDDNWIRSLNDKGISTGGPIKAGSIESKGEVKAGSIQSTGRVSTDEFLQLGIAAVGAACNSNGLIGRDKDGNILSCKSRVWKSTSSINDAVFFSRSAWDGEHINLGKHKFCALHRAVYDYTNYRGCLVSRNNDGDWILQSIVGGNGEASCAAACI
ncbi:shufflon system plasmid conjugative transfer pilus tip adhesin PilV (plasmid) [Xenorhabdus stockiae]|uniref:shufflon system plasmid conjugative transfer pilus tip adhesin PilV n=1 Tax=Xenorhabdus stockiae TaxID=351614 RepID=UPI003CE7BEF5